MASTERLPMFFSRHPRSRQIRVLLAIGCFSLALAGFAGFQLIRAQAPEFHGTPYPDSPAAPTFELIDHEGNAARIEDFRGRPVLLFFGFTSCPDVCPLTLSRLSKLVEEGGAATEEVEILLVTVDPAADTPERLAEYAGSFGDSVTGLTGSADELTRVFAEYGVYAESRPGHTGEPTIVHTPVVFGIDRAGRIQVLIHPDQREEIVRDDIITLARLEG